MIYLISAYFEHSFVWVGYVNGRAEASMIDAIADRFAINTLCRHPLNLPVPHTAIIPARRDEIARQFGKFVQSNSLSDEVIIEKISAMFLSKNVATCIVKTGNAGTVADQVTSGVAGITTVPDNRDVQDLSIRPSTIG